MKVAELLEVAKIHLYTDPEYFGADVKDVGKDEPTQMLPVSKIHVYEPDSKFDDPYFAKKLEKIIAAIKSGKKLPPVIVRRHNNGWQIIDGHHRFMAYRKLGAKQIPARVVDPKNIKREKNETVGII